MNSVVAIFGIQIIIFLAGECEMASHNPTTTAEFQEALDKAKAGDVITLLPIVYSGNFNISNSGDEGDRITILGTDKIESNGESRSTMLTSDSGVIFEISASFVDLHALSLSKGDVAVQVKGNKNSLKDLNLQVGIKKGFVISGDENELNHINLESSDTGIEIKSGSGNDIINDNFSSLVISADASGGSINQVVLTKNLTVHGNKYKFNTVTVKGDVNIDGCDNEAQNTIFSGSSRISKCNNFDSSSNLVSNLKEG